MAYKVEHLFDLPNEVSCSFVTGTSLISREILVGIFTAFPTHQLLPLTLVCHRFHHIVLRILHFRLLVAAEALEYKIILEAYLPSRRYTRPYLFCTYLGTDGLSSKIEGEGSLYSDCKGVVGGRLAKLSGLYSRFRPEYPAEEGKMPLRRIAGAAPNLASSNSSQDWMQTNAPGFDPRPSSISTPGEADANMPQQPSQMQPIFGNVGDGGNRKVVYTIHLDADELFAQFCCAASLVRLGPRRGVFLSTVPIVEDKQGVIRVWREWLLDRAKMLLEMRCQSESDGLQRSFTNLCPEDIVRDKNYLWTDYKKNVGLRLAIYERPIAGVEFRGVDENKDDIPVSFDIEIQELLVRTTHLMLGVEDSQQSAKTPGKALIFGSFAVASAPGNTEFVSL